MSDKLSLKVCSKTGLHTVKTIHRFCSKIIRQLPVHFQLFLQAPVNISRNQAQCGRKGRVLFLVI